MNDTDQPIHRDAYDRVMASVDGIPGVRKSRPSTVTAVLPLLGKSQTHVVQTYKTEDGNYVFVQMVDSEGRARIVLPPKVAAAIYRQRDSLVKAGRREVGRDRWKAMSPDEQEAVVTRLGTRKG